MTSRERILNAAEFKPVDRIPLDLGGMRSTGISAFVYAGLVEALGLPPRRPRLHDTSQMLALPEPDVLDALGCDCVVVEDDFTNAFPQPRLWHDYDFNGRLRAQVRNPADYAVEPDGTIILWGSKRMPPASTVFTAEHAGCGVDLSADIPPPDVGAHRQRCGERKITHAQAAALAAHCHAVRAAADGRAVFANLSAIHSGLGIGMGMHPVVCCLYPEETAQCHALSADRCIHNMRILLPLIRDDIDVLLVTGDDWGTQQSLVAAPDVYRGLFKPAYTRINQAAHEAAPRLKTFIHSCGAVYPLIPDFADSGFDIMNPVQWSAGGHTPAEWKTAAAGRIAFWGGGVNAQATLPRGSVIDVREEVRRVVPELARGGGYVFNNTHNILADITPAKIIAMYEEARAVKPC